MSESLLKWAAGKYQLFLEITTLAPPTYECYHESCGAGSAVFFNLELSRERLMS